MSAKVNILNLILLSFLLTSSLLGQEAPSATEHIFSLEYTPSGFAMDITLEFSEQDVPFEKEPDIGDRKFFRGFFKTGNEQEDRIGILWDQNKGKLYVDLNRNKDLTDDANGVFTSNSPGSYQRFENVQLQLRHGDLDLKYAIEVTLSDFGMVHWTLKVKSGYAGVFELYDKKWQLRIADNLDSKIDRSDIMYLAQADSGSVQDSRPFQVAETVFFDGRSYDLSFEFVKGQVSPLLQVTLTEKQVPMGQLNIEGRFIKRAVFEGDIFVILASPKQITPMPQGEYRLDQICLDSGAGMLFYGDDYYNFDRITVNQSQPGHLKAGGPLDSSVDVKRTGRFLNLSYALKGIGGLNYTSAAGRGDSPGFRILKGDKEIETGNFEYG